MLKLLESWLHVSHEQQDSVDVVLMRFAEMRDSVSNRLDFLYSSEGVVLRREIWLEDWPQSRVDEDIPHLDESKIRDRSLVGSGHVVKPLVIL